MVKQTSLNKVSRYPPKMRALSTNKPRVPWCRREKPRYKHSAAEKAVLKEKRKAHRIAYSSALQAARNIVFQEAEKLHAQFSGHSVQYYYEEIMQHSRIAQSSRGINRWNAFCRQEVKRINDGTGNCYIGSSTH